VKNKRKINEKLKEDYEVGTSIKLLYLQSYEEKWYLSHRTPARIVTFVTFIYCKIKFYVVIMNADSGGISVLSKLLDVSRLNLVFWIFCLTNLILMSMVN
jgi:hypothetical protein